MNILTQGDVDNELEDLKREFDARIKAAGLSAREGYALKTQATACALMFVNERATPGMLRAAALKPFAGLKYRKGSAYANQEISRVVHRDTPG